MSDEPDRSDPGARAAERLTRVQARARYTRTVAALLMAGLAIALPLVAQPITGESGATVGGVLAGLLLAAFAVAVWPWRWSARELEYHELEAIWREVRSDAEQEVDWDRFADWAEPGPSSVHLQVLRRVPAPGRAAGAPNPYRREAVEQVDPEDVAPAAEAMELLRSQAAERELNARQRYERAGRRRATRTRRTHCRHRPRSRCRAGCPRGAESPGDRATGGR